MNNSRYLSLFIRHYASVQIQRKGTSRKRKSENFLNVNILIFVMEDASKPSSELLGDFAKCKCLYELFEIKPPQNSDPGLNKTTLKRRYLKNKLLLLDSPEEESKSYMLTRRVMKEAYKVLKVPSKEEDYRMFGQVIGYGEHNCEELADAMLYIRSLKTRKELAMLKSKRFSSPIIVRGRKRSLSPAAMPSGFEIDASKDVGRDKRDVGVPEREIVDIIEEEEDAYLGEPSENKGKFSRTDQKIERILNHELRDKTWFLVKWQNHDLVTRVTCDEVMDELQTLRTYLDELKMLSSRRFQSLMRREKRLWAAFSIIPDSK